MGMLLANSLLKPDWLFKSAETATPGAAPGPMASVVPGQVSSAPGGPVQPPAPVPSTNPLTGSTAANPGVVMPLTHSPAAKKHAEEVPHFLQSPIHQPTLRDKANEFGEKNKGLLALGGLGLAGVGTYLEHQRGKHHDEESRKREEAYLRHLSSLAGARGAHGGTHNGAPGTGLPALPMTAPATNLHNPLEHSEAGHTMPPPNGPEPSSHGAGSSGAGSPSGAGSAFPMQPGNGLLDAAKDRSIGYLEGLRDYSLDKLEENNQVSQRPNDPYTFAPESRDHV